MVEHVRRTLADYRTETHELELAFET